MSDATISKPAKKGRIATIFSETRLTQARIWTGVVLFIYLTWHMANHALGLYSDELMRDAGRILSKTVGFPPIGLVLYTSFAVHMFLSLWRVYQRRSWRMTTKEWLQLIMGLLIPYFMISHIMSTTYAENAYDLNINYDFVLLSVFVFAPEYAYYIAIGLFAAWFHGCLSYTLKTCLLKFSVFVVDVTFGCKLKSGGRNDPFPAMMYAGSGKPLCAPPQKGT